MPPIAERTARIVMPVGRDGMDVDEGAGGGAGGGADGGAGGGVSGRFSHLVLCLPHSYPTASETNAMTAS